jgi:dihydrofolate reductase
VARLIYALNQSLDGYVDHDAFGPDPALFRHFIDDVTGLAGALYGRRMYETMRYWDEQHPEWDEAERAYARAWRAQPKWVVSTTLDDVGPNAALISEDVEAAVRRIKAEVDGDIEVAGPQLAASLADLIDEYRIYLHPVVVGAGKPYFPGPRPPLRFCAAEPIGERAVRLTFRPA